MSKQQLFFLVVFASMANLLAVLAVMRNYASLETVSIILIATFASGSGLLVWWNNKRIPKVRSKESGKPSRALIWLLVLFTVTAVVAVIQSMQEKWDIGDTIGLSFFILFAVLSIYETLRRRQKKGAK
jgi:hypothetical protein